MRSGTRPSLVADGAARGRRRAGRAPRRLSALAALVAAVVAAVALLAGCDALGKAAGAHNPPPASFTVSARVTDVVVDGGSGSVDVTGSARSTVSVSQQATYSSTAPTATHALHGTTLTVSYTCPTQIVCGVSYDLQVPQGVAVSVSTDAGAITLTSLAGSVQARADAGLITAVAMRSPVSSFKSDAGGIIATFSVAPQSLTATTTVGPITLTVPGSVAYLLKTHTIVGSSTVTVRKGTSPAHTINASSDLGSISINPA